MVVSKLIILIACLFVVVQGKSSNEIQQDDSFKSEFQTMQFTKEEKNDTNSKIVDKKKNIPSLATVQPEKLALEKLKLEMSTYNSNWLLIFPGTKWCGAGNISRGYNDLGMFWRVDTCCREHDQCADSIPPSSSKYGLTNNGLIVKLLCTCDEQFYRCLRTVNSVTAREIGEIYFNVLGSQCFKEEYPIIKCKTYFTSRLCIRCKEYGLDSTQPKKYQFFDIPIYK